MAQLDLVYFQKNKSTQNNSLSVHLEQRRGELISIGHAFIGINELTNKNQSQSTYEITKRELLSQQFQDNLKNDEESQNQVQVGHISMFTLECHNIPNFVNKVIQESNQGQVLPWKVLNLIGSFINYPIYVEPRGTTKIKLEFNQKNGSFIQSYHSISRLEPKKLKQCQEETKKQSYEGIQKQRDRAILKPIYKQFNLANKIDLIILYEGTLMDLILKEKKYRETPDELAAFLYLFQYSYPSFKICFMPVYQDNPNLINLLLFNDILIGSLNDYDRDLLNCFLREIGQTKILLFKLEGPNPYEISIKHVMVFASFSDILTIGRSDFCDIRISNKDVSNTHCHIKCIKTKYQEAFFIFDGPIDDINGRASTNGTYMVLRKQYIQSLLPGTQLFLGSYLGLKIPIESRQNQLQRNKKVEFNLDKFFLEPKEAHYV